MGIISSHCHICISKNTHNKLHYIYLYNRLFFFCKNKEGISSSLRALEGWILKTTDRIPSKVRDLIRDWLVNAPIACSSTPIWMMSRGFPFNVFWGWVQQIVLINICYFQIDKKNNNLIFLWSKLRKTLEVGRRSNCPQHVRKFF